MLMHRYNLYKYARPYLWNTFHHVVIVQVLAMIVFFTESSSSTSPQ